MPNSVNSPLSADNLRAYLADVLPDSQLSVEPVDAIHQPLVLLRMKHAMAGFGFTNGNVQQSYDHAYSRFKRYFTERRGTLDALDLAFVFCVNPATANLEEFCSSVETDVYFCRKFVVPLAPPFGASLSRLPFLPLTPLDGKPLRPTSAQTFLNRCGVPAALAKFVVVPRERGAERIVEGCVNGEFGDPKELTSAANTQTSQNEVNTESVRLETITIKNFRAYRKPQKFAIGAELTILYGPNGFGKTSFFDAVDFAATGGIGRLASSGEAHFTKTAQHLDTGSEESIVSLTFRRGDSTRKITRNVQTRKEPHLDGRVSDRKEVLAELTGREIVASDRIENFINLFRAMHLFNLEQQELTKDFRNDCSLPPEIVSRMLAFQDYANAVSKADRVREVFESIIATADNNIKELSGQIEAERENLARLSTTTTTDADFDALNEEFDALRARLVAAGFNPDQGRPDIAMLRGWRATIEARHGESTNLANRLSALATELVSLPKIGLDYTNTQLQIARKEEALGTLEDKQAAAASVLHQLEKRLNESNAKITTVRARSALLEWIRVTRPKYELALQNQKAANDEVTLLTSALAQLRTSEVKADAHLRSQEALSAQIAEKLQTQRAELATFQNLLDSMKSWQSDRTRLVSVVEEVLKIKASLESLRVDTLETSPQIASIKAEEARLERQIGDLDKDQSERKSLLSQLQAHITTGICPLCGEEHASKEVLIRRIQSFLTIDSASIARDELTKVRVKSKQLAESSATNNEKQQALNSRLVLLQKERADIDARCAHFVNAATSLGIGMERADVIPADQIRMRLELDQHEIGDLNRQVEAVALAIDHARVALTSAKDRVAQKLIELNDLTITATRQQEEFSRLLDDPRLKQVSFDIDANELAIEEATNLDRLTDHQKDAEKIQTELVKANAVIAGLRQESTSLKTELQTLRTRSSNLQKVANQTTARLDESKLPSDVDEAAVLSLVADELRLQEQYLALRDSTSNLELVLDAATTSAALASLRQNIRYKERAVAASEAKRHQHLPWLTYFSNLARLVSSQQDQAIGNFTSEYGPRASVIQRRLRSVYGFDDIEIQSRKSAITVRVKRHGEELRPTDYFSQSQQQTLLLGLFLTACISQNWSGFAPVFLDDPVTHFDDLNTYAFLDLIVGLLDSDFGKRQFVISTCDEKLLQLARQKFHHLGDGAVFYRFDAIGPDGPLVEQIRD